MTASRKPTARAEGVCFLVVAWLSVFVVSSSFAQDSPSSSRKFDAESLRQLANPGPEHEALAKYVGAWKVSVSAGEGNRTANSTGRAKCHMMMDGRFLWIAYNVAGAAGTFKGAFMLGFDRRHSRYTLMGIDTFGTYPIRSMGAKNPETGRLDLTGKDDDPHMKSLGFDKEFAHVIDLKGKDELVIDVFYIDTRTAKRARRKAMTFSFVRIQT